MEIMAIAYLFIAGVVMMVLGYSIKQIGKAIGAKANVYYAVAWFLMLTGFMIEFYLFMFEVTIG